MRSTIVQLIQEKAGISAEQAGMALDTVVGFLKDKLPEPIAGQLDAVLSGEGGVGADQLNNIMGSLGGLFGKKE